VRAAGLVAILVLPLLAGCLEVQTAESQAAQRGLRFTAAPGYDGPAANLTDDESSVFPAGFTAALDAAAANGTAILWMDPGDQATLKGLLQGQGDGTPYLTWHGRAYKWEDIGARPKATTQSGSS